VTKARVLIVGATSSVGGYVIDQLIAAGQVEPVAGVRDATKAKPFQDKGVTTVLLDLSNTESIADAVQGIDRIFLLTGYTKNMLTQSKLVVDHGEKAGATHIVHMGAWAPDDTDIEHFAWHQYVERYIAGSRLSWTHVAPNMFMQNMLGTGTLWRAFTNAGAPGSRPIHAFFGEAEIGWVAAEDIARVSVAALHDPNRHAGKKYNLSVEARSVQQVAQIISETLGHPFHAVTHAPEQFHRALLAKGMEPIYADSALETLNRFSDNAVRGQKDVFLIEEVIGKPPLDWRAFARAHRADFLRVG
jgi:NAD(P)H dehydrogenase (quinone)